MHLGLGHGCPKVHHAQARWHIRHRQLAVGGEFAPFTKGKRGLQRPGFANRRKDVQPGASGQQVVSRPGMGANAARRRQRARGLHPGRIRQGDPAHLVFGDQQGGIAHQSQLLVRVESQGVQGGKGFLILGGAVESDGADGA